MIWVRKAIQPSRVSGAYSEIGLVGSCTHAEITADYIQSKLPQKHNLSASEEARCCFTFLSQSVPSFYFRLFRICQNSSVSLLPPFLCFTPASIPLFHSYLHSSVSLLPPFLCFTPTSIPLFHSYLHFSVSLLPPFLCHIPTSIPLFHSYLHSSVSLLPPFLLFCLSVRVPELRVESVFHLKHKQRINRPTGSQNWNLLTWFQIIGFTFLTLHTENDSFILSPF